jgi:hypothetical protein
MWRHRETTGEEVQPAPDPGSCAHDGEPWPCDAERMRLRAGRAARALDGVRKRVKALPNPWSPEVSADDFDPDALVDRNAVLATFPSEPVSTDGGHPRVIVRDTRGFYWREYDDTLSMPPVTEDNEPVEVEAIYVLQRPEDYFRDTVNAAHAALPDGSPSTEPRG